MRTRRAAAGLVALALGAAGLASQSAPAFAAPAQAPPTALTDQAGGVAQNTATLMGTVDPMGSETIYEFDLGTDTSYGTRIFGDAGSELGEQTFISTLQGLAPGTTYHYRILATNHAGTIYGADQTFTTAAYPSSVIAVAAAPVLVPAPLLATAGTNGAGPVAQSAARASRSVGAKSARSKRHGERRRADRRRASDAQGANGRSER